MEIINKTNKPLKLTLPGGGKLFLGPGQKGQVTSKALERPQLAKLLELRDIETTESTASRNEAGDTRTAMPSDTRHKSSGAMRQSGDR